MSLAALPPLSAVTGRRTRSQTGGAAEFPEGLQRRKRPRGERVYGLRHPARHYVLRRRCPICDMYLAPQNNGNDNEDSDEDEDEYDWTGATMLIGTDDSRTMLHDAQPRGVQPLAESTVVQPIYPSVEWRNVAGRVVILYDCSRLGHPDTWITNETAGRFVEVVAVHETCLRHVEALMDGEGAAHHRRHETLSQIFRIGAWRLPWRGAFDVSDLRAEPRWTAEDLAVELPDAAALPPNQVVARLRSRNPAMRRVRRRLTARTTARAAIDFALWVEGRDRLRSRWAGGLSPNRYLKRGNLARVVAWARNGPPNTLELVPRSTTLPYWVLITFDAHGVLSIERFDERPLFDPDLKPDGKLFAVTHTEAGPYWRFHPNVVVADRSLRFEIQRTSHWKPALWDLRCPPSLAETHCQCKLGIHTSGARFQTMTFRPGATKGLTFLWSWPHLLGIHVHQAHDPERPDAASDAVSHSLRAEVEHALSADVLYSRLVWLYVPIGPGDRLTAAAIQNRTNMREEEYPNELEYDDPLIELRLEQAGEVHVGANTKTVDNFEYERVLPVDSPMPDSQPITMFWSLSSRLNHLGLVAPSTRDSTLIRPFVEPLDQMEPETIPPVDHWPPGYGNEPYQPQYYNVTYFDDVAHVDVWVGPIQWGTTTVRDRFMGMVITYENGAQRALGQVRHGHADDHPVRYTNPGLICIRRTPLPVEDPGYPSRPQTWEVEFLEAGVTPWDHYGGDPVPQPAYRPDEGLTPYGTVHFQESTWAYLDLSGGIEVYFNDRPAYTWIAVTGNPWDF